LSADGPPSGTVVRLDRRPDGAFILTPLAEETVDDHSD